MLFFRLVRVAVDAAHGGAVGGVMVVAVMDIMLASRRRPKVPRIFDETPAPTVNRTWPGLASITYLVVVDMVMGILIQKQSRISTRTSGRARNIMLPSLYTAIHPAIPPALPGLLLPVGMHAGQDIFQGYS
jgi:hypothetical protein